MQKDNSTFEQKKRLRLVMLRKFAEVQPGPPIVLETHGGIGKLFASCYSTLADGVVFERDPDKADFLAQQRPTWAVYRSDVIRALQAGAGAHLAVNFLDLDPYGSPWATIDSFFTSAREFPAHLAIVVNDGLRQNLKMHGAWNSRMMDGVVNKYGNDSMFKRYKEVCREMLADRVAQKGYTIAAWTSYYTGFAGNMTHWAAVLQRNANAI